MWKITHKDRNSRNVERLHECNQCVRDKSTSLSFLSWVVNNAAWVHERLGSILGSTQHRSQHMMHMRKVRYDQSKESPDRNLHISVGQFRHHRLGMTCHLQFSHFAFVRSGLESSPPSVVGFLRSKSRRKYSALWPCADQMQLPHTVRRWLCGPITIPWLPYQYHIYSHLFKTCCRTLSVLPHRVAVLPLPLCHVSLFCWSSLLSGLNCWPVRACWSGLFCVRKNGLDDRGTHYGARERRFRTPCFPNAFSCPPQPHACACTSGRCRRCSCLHDFDVMELSTTERALIQVRSQEPEGAREGPASPTSPYRAQIGQERSPSLPARLQGSGKCFQCLPLSLNNSHITNI